MVRVSVLLSILVGNAEAAEHYVAGHIGIENGVDVFDLAVLNESGDSERVCVSACDESKAIDCHEGSKQRCSEDQNVIEEAKGKDAEDKGSAKGEAPEASLALHLVSEGIVEKKADSIASPSGKNKGA